LYVSATAIPNTIKLSITVVKIAARRPRVRPAIMLIIIKTVIPAVRTVPPVAWRRLSRIIRKPTVMMLTALT
jgi:hypothetical protein